MRKRPFLWLIGIWLLLLPLQAAAQSSCPDPFAGEELRFSTSYWPLTDFCQHNVPYADIRSGGPPPDGIPPVDNPSFESIASAAAWLQDGSPVIALEIEGDARAYPLALLIWHEIANDTVADTPVAVTFCPLCNSSIVFDRRVDGQTLRFGTTGLLRNSDLVMWDDVTQSWWQQFTGEAIVGAYTGTRLEVVPSQVVGFGQFAAQYPEGQVMSRDTGYLRDYGSNPYYQYDSTTTPFLFEGEIDPRLPAIERVLAGVIGGQPIAYPFPALVEQGVINDTVGDEAVVALWQGGMFSALDQSLIDESRDIGTAILFSRELDGQTLTFSVDDAGIIRDDQTGSVWNAFGTATEGDLTGKRLRQQVAAPHFWFAWAAFQPETIIYGEEE